MGFKAWDAFLQVGQHISDGSGNRKFIVIYYKDSRFYKLYFFKLSSLKQTMSSASGLNIDIYYSHLGQYRTPVLLIQACVCDSTEYFQLSINSYVGMGSRIVICTVFIVFLRYSLFLYKVRHSLRLFHNYFIIIQSLYFPNISSKCVNIWARIL